MDNSWVAAKYFKRSLEKNQEKVYTYIVKKAAIWLKILTKSCQIVENKKRDRLNCLFITTFIISAYSFYNFLRF